MYSTRINEYFKQNPTRTHQVDIVDIETKKENLLTICQNLKNRSAADNFIKNILSQTTTRRGFMDTIRKRRFSHLSKK